MPDFGSPVADQIQAPNPNQSMQTLSGLMGLRNQQQQLQLGQQALQVGEGQAQQAQQQMDERQSLQRAMMSGKDPDGNSIKGADGQIDPVAMANFANKYMPLTGQGVQQTIIKTLSDRVGLNDAVRGLGQNFRNDISGIVRSGIGTDDPAGTVNAGLDVYAKQNPNAAPAIARAKSLIAGAGANMPPEQRDMALQKLAMEFQPANTTAAEQAPQMGTTTGPSGGVQAFQTNPYSAVPMGAQGPEVAQGLGPAQAAQRVGTFQNGQPGTVSLGSVTPGAPGYNAGSPFGNGRFAAQPGQNSSFVGSGAPMGAGADVDWMKNDYNNGVVKDASTAQQRVGLYNNVEQLSKKALTGPRDRLNYANSVLALAGVGPFTDMNDAQVALNKNASMIQQAFGGNTDAARAVVAHFTPGSVMPDKVNQEISEYGKANAQMQLFAQHYLEGASNGNDAATYKNRKSDLAMVSDPRLWQFQNMSPGDRVNYLRDMSPAQQQQFGAIYKRANAMGAFQ
ncbi:hypothetical protein [Paraburkholderia sp. JHI869]|uniref:hypothetical protein n=1 Tax=Paraburkholderia sp. JHI869 TaxID=3112959 RepID=UPI00317ED5CC